MPRPSENELIAHYLAPLAGPGGLGLRDDAALATPRPGRDLVVTTDMLVAGRHFFADDPPDAIARKALRVNLSDLAAKAAVPTGFLLGLALPRDWTEPWLAAFCDGLAMDARAFACPLLGGDTVGTAGPLTISITAFGEVVSGRMLPRTGARDGDALYVTGAIGDAALGLRLQLREAADIAWIEALDAASAEALRARYLLPEPRLGHRSAIKLARAAMDVSDGLLGDVAKMLALEGLGADLRLDAIPLSSAARAALDIAPDRSDLLATILDGGDDYEVIAAVAPESIAAFEAEIGQLGLSFTAIGVARRDAAGVIVRDRGGAAMPFPPRRFDHFA